MAHAHAFADCILIKSLLTSFKIIRSSINSNFPLSLKGAGLSPFLHSMSAFRISPDSLSSPRYFCGAVELMSDEHAGFSSRVGVRSVGGVNEDLRQ